MELELEAMNWFVSEMSLFWTYQSCDDLNVQLHPTHSYWDMLVPSKYISVVHLIPTILTLCFICSAVPDK